MYKQKDMYSYVAVVCILQRRIDVCTSPTCCMACQCIHYVCCSPPPTVVVIMGYLARQETREKHGIIHQSIFHMVTV